MAESDDTGRKGDAEEGIEGAVEDVPEPDVEAPYFPELGHFVEHEPGRHDVENPFHNV